MGGGRNLTGHADRLLPIAPEFAMMLAEVPEVERVGPAFTLEGRVGRLQAHEVSNRCRSFGERWTARLMPAQLKELMRHESIEATLRLYVGTDARTKAEAAWAAYERADTIAFPRAAF